MEKLFIFLIIILGSVLIFTNLSNIYLWQDEACVALISENVLRTGLPLTYDGNHLLTSVSLESIRSKYVDTQTWLEYYIVAISYSIFGINTFSARLPFAIFGLASIIMAYLLFLKIGSNKYVARISTILFVFSVPFLLQVRQVNYYALAIFFSILVFYSYIKIIKSEKYATAYFIISNVLLFYSFFALTFLILSAILIHFILSGYYKQKDSVKNMLTGIVFITALVLPSLFYFNPFSRLSSGQSRSLFEIFTKLKANLLWTNNYMLPFTLLLFLGFQNIFLNEKTIYQRVARFSYIVLIFFCVFYLLLAPQINLLLLFGIILLAFIIRFYIIKNEKKFNIYFKSVNFYSLFYIFIILVFLSTAISSDAPYFRYLVATLPLFCLFAGTIIYQIGKKNNVIINALIIMLISNNFLAVFPIKLINNTINKDKWAIGSFSDGIYRDLSHDIFKSDFFNYIYELTHNYDCPVKGIVNYLKEHANPNDVVKISYNDFPLMFYTNLKIINWKDGGGQAPDWIIPVASVPLREDQKFLSSIKGITYETIAINYPNICYSNLPEPLYHNFKTVQNSPKPIYLNFWEGNFPSKVIIFKKISDNIKD